MSLARRMLACRPALVLLLWPTPPALAAPQDTTAIQDTALTDSVTVQATRLPMMPDEVPPGPLSPGTRYTFTRDSVFWSGAMTLSDLLTNIPGVYVARGGFLGQPEYVMYAGRGPAGVEVYWDGFALEPVGGDTVYFDLGRIALTYVRRVDVEVWPSMLRVYLVSERHEWSDPRSVIRLTSGSFSTAQYVGLFQQRWSSGVSLDIAGDFTGSEGDANVDRNDQYLDLWLKLGWTRSGRYGFSYQIRRQDQERDPRQAENMAVGVPAQDGARTEFLFKLFAGNQEDQSGWRFETGLGSTAWTGDTVHGDQHIRQAFATIGYTAPHWSAAVSGQAGDTRTKSGVEGRFGWIPFEGLVISGSGRVRRHDNRRIDQMASASVGIHRGPISIVGQVSGGDVVQAPALDADPAQQVTDAGVRFGVRTAPLVGHVGLVRRDGFQPFAPLAYPAISSFDASAAATYVVADARVRLAQPLVVEAWYSHPRTTPPGLQPPNHGRGQVTFRSKFWRTFPSGAFDLMVRYGVESWSGGSGGVDDGGVPILLPGATYHEVFLQVQLVRFMVFWNWRNARNTQAHYVPFLPYPRNAQTFGMKWEFFN